MSIITSQLELEAWDGTTDVEIGASFTISDTYTQHVLDSDVTINGNGYTITIDSTITTFNGLFSILESSTGTFNINNINLYFSGTTEVFGGIIGDYTLTTSPYTLTISYCSATGFGNVNTGGIVGKKIKADISYCYTDELTMTVNSSGYICGSYFTGSASNCYSTGGIPRFGGGIAGQYCSGTITKCYSTGDFTGAKSGGIAGANYSGTITFCHSSGIISDGSGGIIGSNGSGTVTSCYSTGIIGIDIPSITQGCGGIAGYLCTTSITNCYSTGNIQGYRSGGIAGERYVGTIENCYGTGTFLKGNTSGSTDVNGSGGIIGYTSITIPESVININYCFSLYADTSGVTTNSEYGLYVSVTVVAIYYKNRSGAVSFGSGTWDGSNLVDDYLLETDIWDNSVTTIPYMLNGFQSDPFLYSSYTDITGFTILIEPPNCFLKGTNILTCHGEVKIEDLKIGDYITSGDGRNVKIVDITIQFIKPESNEHPYVLHNHMFGFNKPNKDLYVSKYHLLKPDNSNWFSLSKFPVLECKHISTFTYYNLRLENYYTDTIVANGVKCDSLHFQSESVFVICKGKEYLKNENENHTLFINA